MGKRKIIEIDEEKCIGCGDCIPGCPEGALQVIDGKARLVSDIFCDGLGACIGDCPEDAMKVVEREAEPYDERKVMANILKQGENVVKAHLEHLKDHGEEGYLKEALKFLEEEGVEIPLEEEATALPCGCSGAKVMDLRDKKGDIDAPKTELESELRQWPVQLHLVPPAAPYFSDVDLLVTADCVPFAYANYHQELLKGRAVAVGCPKLDDIDAHKEKLKSIIEGNDLKSITVAIVEVPCCSGLLSATEEALRESGRDIPLKHVVIGIDGTIKE